MAALSYWITNEEAAAAFAVSKRGANTVSEDSSTVTPRRNSRDIPARDRLIVALDFSRGEEALALVERLNEAVSFYKVGYELFVATGWEIIEELSARELNVFLDLKMDDVDTTIEKAVRGIATRGLVNLVTIHGHAATARAARRGAGGTDLKILQITLLTSMNEADLQELMLVGPSDRFRFHSDREFVQWRAQQSLDQGCDGVIASGQNAKMLREACGEDFLLVCPGIRPEDDASEDHKRSCTPFEAIRDGADYLVVGRPISKAADPRAKAETIVADIQKGLDSRA